MFIYNPVGVNNGAIRFVLRLEVVRQDVFGREQFFKFGFVGVICFLIDYGVMVLLTELLNIPYLASCAISFSISVIVNYCLSMKYVF